MEYCEKKFRVKVKNKITSKGFFGGMKYFVVFETFDFKDKFMEIRTNVNTYYDLNVDDFVDLTFYTENSGKTWHIKRV